MEIHARNASHLVGQVIGDRRLQRKEADQDGDEQGGQAAVEQLAYQIGAHGQAAAPDEGEHLTVDGDAGPPQHEGGQNKLAAEGAVAGESPHTGGDLQRSGKQTLGPLRGEAEGGEHRPQHLGQPGQEAGADKELNHHGEKDHKGADVQRGQKGVFDGAGKGCCEALGVELGPGLPLLPPGGWAGLVKTEENADADGGGRVGQIEQHSHPATGEHPSPHHAQNEGGTRVVAEGQQALGLRLGAHAVLVEADGRLGSHRVAADEAQGESGGAGPADVEQGAHQSLQQTSQVSRQPQFHHQGGEHEEGEQGGNYDVVAQGQAAFGRLHGGLGIEHQGQGGAQQGQTQEQVAHPLFGQQPGHRLHLRPKWVCAGGEKVACPEKFDRAGKACYAEVSKSTPEIRKGGMPMGIQHWKQDGIPVAELTGPEKRIVDAPSALELAMTARHEAGASALLVDKAAVAEDFFILSTGLAGEILEKFIQYRIKMAVYGDFSCYTSKPLRDFIYESNHGSDFFFVPEREEALRLLLRTAGRE